MIYFEGKRDIRSVFGNFIFEPLLIDRLAFNYEVVLCGVPIGSEIGFSLFFVKLYLK